MGTSQWLSLRSSLSLGRLLMLWLVALPLAGAMVAPAAELFSEGYAFRTEANRLQRRGERMARGEVWWYWSSRESRRRARLTPAQLAEEDRVRSDSLRAEAPGVLADAASASREATPRLATGVLLLVLGVLAFGLAVARTFPHWMAGPKRVGGWLSFVGRSAGILVVHGLLLMGLLVSNSLYWSLHGFSSLAGLLLATVLAPVVGAVAGRTAGQVASWERLPVAVLGLAVVIALNEGLLLFLADAWVDSGLGARSLHAIWATSGSVAIGCAFFIGHGRGMGEG